MSEPQHPAPGKQKPESAKEGDLNDDRQDPPLPAKDGETNDLDGFTATPGDNADD